MTALSIPKLANAELTTAAYVRAMVTLYDIAVGGTVQGPNVDTGELTWAGAGFVQFTNLSGPIDPYVPVRHSVVSLDVFAANSGSKQPPWGRAFAIAELIVAATYDTATHDTHAVVSLPTGYPDARVTGFMARTEPARRPSDPADWAHVGFEVEISWHGL